VPVHEHRIHRRDAKDAEKFFNDNNQILCVLDASAVSLFLYGQTLIKSAIRARLD
jgi:hypothetical protein